MKTSVEWNSVIDDKKPIIGKNYLVTILKKSKSIVIISSAWSSTNSDKIEWLHENIVAFAELPEPAC